MIWHHFNIFKLGLCGGETPNVLQDIASSDRLTPCYYCIHQAINIKTLGKKTDIPKIFMKKEKTLEIFYFGKGTVRLGLTANIFLQANVNIHMCVV